ncbi:MAG TPA: MASE3 domain-containing protein [Thermodesulfobacteriota bacterium]|nr:MASE3 domain-containing protein [Thermodesulfobacteriota bacterium]
MKRQNLYILLAILILVGLYLSSLYSYLLFHSLAELFSIIIACGIFMIAWNSRQFIRNNYLLFIGVAYLFVGGLDLVHTLSYKGMAIFRGYETNLATQLWIAARYVESLSLLIAPLFFRRRLRINLIFLGYSAVFILLLLLIFYWSIFPVCFIEGTGLSPFKKISEYLISLILLTSVALLYKNRQEFDRTVLRWMIGSIILTVASELCFTFYIDAYGISNLVGHYFKILSFYFIYKAIIKTGLEKPYDLLFRDIKRSEERYHSLFTHMTNGFAHHQVLFDEEGRPVDYIFLEVNEAFEKLTGLRRENLVGKKVTQVLPGIEKDSADWIGIYGRVAMTGEAIRLESYSETLKRWYSVLAYRSERPRFVTVFEEITERKRAEEALKKAYDELEMRVQERTEELRAINEQLTVENEERLRVEIELRESEHRLRELSTALLSAQERERKVIAGEIHDSMGASLAAIKFRLESALSEIGDGCPQARTALESVLPVIQGTIEEARRIQMTLRPSMLDDLGILATINWLCRQFESTYSHIHIRREFNIEESEVPASLRTVIYRLLQEALNNISKHSKADRIDLMLRRKDGAIELGVQDNGQGFDLSEAYSRKGTAKGLGLDSMRERAELSGGSLSIESSKGTGTVIRATWPTEQIST